MKKIELIIKLLENDFNKEELDKLKTVLDVVLPEERDSLPNEELIELYEKSQHILGLSNKSIAQYVFEIRLFLKHYKGSLTDATTSDIRSYLWIYKEQRNISNVTLENKLRYLSSFYEWLVNESYIDKNPTKAVGRIVIPVRLKHAFSKEELDALRDACESIRDRALIEFLYATGVRVSECASVKLSDINFKRNEVRIIGKGNKERMVYLSNTARSFMIIYIGTRDRSSDEPLFIGSKTASPLSPHQIENILRELGKRAGVENVHPHRFRRTFASDLWRADVPIETIKVLMGHTNIQTTLRYIEIDQSKIKAAYEKAVG